MTTAPFKKMEFTNGYENVSIDNGSETDQLVEYYRDISHGLKLYVTPVILFGGTAGNLMTIVVILSHHFRYHPSSIPLITMAFVDIGVLYTNLLGIWLGALTSDGVQYMRDMSSAGCKISTFITVYLTQCSSWILVLINIDRVVSVYKPLKARTWCTRRRLAIALVTMMLVLALINIHIFWTAKHYPKKEFDHCQYDIDLLGAKGQEAWLTIDASIFVFIPFVLIFGCNVYIISSLIRARRRRKSMDSYQGSQGQSSDNTRSITMMLITISIVFLITTSPMTLCFLFYDSLMQHFEGDPVGMALWYELVIYTVLVLVCYSNNALNFLLYCISGSKFREALSDVCAGRIGRRYRRQSTMEMLTVRSSVDYLAPNGGTPLCKRKLSDIPNRSTVYYPKTTPKRAASSPEIRMLGIK